LRKGFDSLAAPAPTVLGQDPFSGHVFCLRGRRGDRVKLLWWDGDGLCLFAKRRERGRFVWPRAEEGMAVLTRAQLSMLLAGIDWRMPRRTGRPRQIDSTSGIDEPSSRRSDPILGVTIAPESLPDAIAALKRIIAEMARDAAAAQAEIAKLKFQPARSRRAGFGGSSAKLAHEVEPLEWAIEAVETDQAERLATASPAMVAAMVAAMVEAVVEAQKPARRPLPEHLPREAVLHPAAGACPHCGGALRRIGEDVTETLDDVPGRSKSLPRRRPG
jgi:transposase